MSAGWGATEYEWDNLIIAESWGDDLLPVVCNPTAKLSPTTTLQGVGKMPSRYYSGRLVGGIKDWPKYAPSDQELRRWRAEPDYGICIRTGRTSRLYALDIDVPDVRLAAAIRAEFLASLPAGRRLLPMRFRDGTGKCLLLFAIPAGVEPLRKRSFAVDQGLVELLGLGQQFLAHGTHVSSGTRYEWDQPPTAVDIDPEPGWAAIVEIFAKSPERRASHRAGSGGLGPAGGALDGVAGWLEAEWETYGVHDGKLHVRCPWKEGHSDPDADRPSEASWLLPCAEYALGHFRCLHASCAARTDLEFKAAVGFTEASPDDFEDLTDAVAEYAALSTKAKAESAPPATLKARAAPHDAGVPGLPLPGFERDNQGRIEVTLDNVVKAIEAPDAIGYRLAFDVFRDAMMIAKAGTEEWEPLTDGWITDLRRMVYRLGFKHDVALETMRAALASIADNNRFDSAIRWAETQLPAWDGVKRIETFWPTYFRTADTRYTRAVGLYTWTALAGRVLSPGIKADMVPVLVGAQGLKKSSGVAAMAPASDFFSEFALDARDADQSRKLRHCVIGELGELRGMATAAAEGIKAWITRTFEEWTPKFKEYTTKFWRRCLFIGTTNNGEFLADETGERRWLPMHCGAVDVTGIERDRLQLWAEACQRWKTDGILYRDAELLAKDEHANFREHDPLEDKVWEWLSADGLDGEPRANSQFSTSDVLSEVFHVARSQMSKREEMRVGKILRALGFERDRAGPETRRTRVWRRKP